MSAKEVQIPDRLLYFCDCGAHFDSREALKSHAVACALVVPFIAGASYPTRDGIITAAELVMHNAFELMPQTKDFILFLMQVSTVEYLRQQGNALRSVQDVEKILTVGSPMPVPEKEGVALMKEVFSWYGFGREDIARTVAIVSHPKTSKSPRMQGLKIVFGMTATARPAAFTSE